MKIVVDANVMVAIVIPTPYSIAATERVGHWIVTETDLVAPVLWSYEAVSAIRKFVAIGDVEEEAAQAALERLLAVGPRSLHPTPDLHRKAMVWAKRLSHHNAYDGAYLALAEELKAELWTADHRLVRGAQSLGADWVHAVSEGEA